MALGLGGGIDHVRAADVSTVVVELIAADFGIPVEGLEVTNAGCELIGKVIVVCDVAETEGVFEGHGEVVVVLANEDVVHHVSEGFLSLDAFLWPVRCDSIIVLPVIVDSFGDSRAGDCSPVDIGV